jgi:uncharacterized membrane protein (DUF485 family)
VDEPNQKDHRAEAESRKELLGLVMRKQASLSLGVAAIFVAILIALPLVNLYAPKLAATPVGGFSLTWLVLAVLFYPITWLLSTYFVNASERVEAQLVVSGRKHMLPEVHLNEDGSETEEKGH